MFHLCCVRGRAGTIVPNHICVPGRDNAWWLDVLKNGHASAHADHFDIDWAVPDPAMRGKVLLPILGDQYGVVLECGELRLRFDAQRGRLGIPVQIPARVGDTWRLRAGCSSASHRSRPGASRTPRYTVITA